MGCPVRNDDDGFSTTQALKKNLDLRFYEKFKSYFDMILSHHPDDERKKRCFSFQIFDRMINLCARCSSIILGLFTLAIINPLIPSFSFSFPLVNSLIAFGLIVPVALDGGLQYLGIKESSKRNRFLTGFSFGFGIIFTALYLTSLEKLILFLTLTPALGVVLAAPQSIKDFLESKKVKK